MAQGDDPKSIGVIATPCQVLALARMRAAPPEICKNMDKLKLVIGLFCTWALSYPDFARFLEEKVPDRIVKYDIPPHPANVLLAYTEKERIDISLDEVLPFVKPACRVCLDLTAEFADISVGSGRRDVIDWNTVIVRTERGMRFVEAAIKKGIIETTDIPEENLKRLKAAAYNKKKKALSSIVERTGSMDDLLYLQAEGKTVKSLLGSKVKED
jgi:coenzyme F420 hydrogenase subunit beta